MADWSETWRDIRLGFRMLLKSRLVSVVTLVSLTLGIGANTAIFSILNGLLWHGLPVMDQDRLLSVYTTDAKTPGNLQVSYLNYLDYKKQEDVFDDIAAYRRVPLSLAEREHAERVVAETVSGNYFQLLGVSSLLGRLFEPGDDELNAAPAVVLSYDFWQRRYGGNPTILGSGMTLNAGRFTVIGIAPRGFYGLGLPPAPDLWIPLMAHAQVAAGQLEKYQNRRYLLLDAAARLKHGVSIARAQAALTALAEHQAMEFPIDNQGRGVTLIPLTQARVNPDGKSTLVRASQLLMLVVGFVLLIACANVGTLLLSRSKAREREIALRLSLGASRMRLVRQLLTESCVLSFTAGCVGMLLIFATRHLLSPWLQTKSLQLMIDGRVVLFTVAVSLFSGVFFGLAPALQFSRPSLIGLLNIRGDSGEQRLALRIQKGLITVQIALCLASVTVAFMFVKSLANAQRINPGFFVDRLLLVQFDVSFSKYDDSRGKQFYKELVDRVKTLPGVSNAALATDRPFVEPLRRTVFLDAENPSSAAKGVLIRTSSITPDYFETVGIQPVQGRNFTIRDDETSPPVVIVNEAMANLFWPGRNPIGQRIQIFRDKAPREVVGVVKSANAYKLGENPQPYQYLPFLQSYYSEATLYVHTSNDNPTPDGVTNIVKKLDPTILIFNVRTMREVISQSLAETYLATGFLSCFGALALFLACVGIYGLMSYFVSRRTRDLGVRIALGAQKAEIISVVSRQAMMPLLLGLVVGIGAALIVARLLTGMLYDVGLLDLQAIVGSIGILVLIAAVATYLPARRATEISPVITLAAE